MGPHCGSVSGERPEYYIMLLYVMYYTATHLFSTPFSLSLSSLPFPLRLTPMVEIQSPFR